VRPHPVGAPGARIGQPQHRVRLQHEPQHRLGRRRLPGESDGGVDIGGEELYGAAVGVYGEALPGEERGVERVEAHGDPEGLGPARRRGDAAPVPGGLVERDQATGIGLELLEVGLPRLVGTRLGHGDLAVDVEERRRLAVHQRERIHRPRDPLRLEVELGADAADEAGRGLEAERRPGEGALLPLEQPGEAHGAALTEVVLAGETVDRGGGDRESGSFLELGAHLRHATLEEGVRARELHLPRCVVDGVVRAAGQQGVADVQLLAAVAHLEAVERQDRAVAGGGHVGVLAQGEHRWRPLGGEQHPRRAIQ